jgi:hypothetical protein
MFNRFYTTTRCREAYMATVWGKFLRGVEPVEPVEPVVSL